MASRRATVIAVVLLLGILGTGVVTASETQTAAQQDDDVAVWVNVIETEETVGSPLPANVTVLNDASVPKDVELRITRHDSDEVLDRQTITAQPGMHNHRVEFDIENTYPPSSAVYRVNGKLATEVSYVEPDGSELEPELKLAEVISVSEQVETGEPAKAIVTVQNTGYAMALVGPTIESEEEIAGAGNVSEIEPGQSETFEVDMEFRSAGTHTLVLYYRDGPIGEVGTIKVTEPEDEQGSQSSNDSDESLPGFSILHGVTALLIVGLSTLGRRSG